MHDALRTHRPITVRLLNYRADGTPFVNDLTVMPIQSRETNTTSHFLGVMKERPLPQTQNGSQPLPLPSIAGKAGLSAGANGCANGYAGSAGAGPSAPLPEPKQSQSQSQSQPAAPAPMPPAPMPTAQPPHPTRSGAQAAPTGAPGGLPVPALPSMLQEALQHEVPYPQLITERRPPYKTIHVNAAWCRQCGYRADEISGRPYSMLLGPNPSPALMELLEHVFGTGRRVRPPPTRKEERPCRAPPLPRRSPPLPRRAARSPNTPHAHTPTRPAPRPLRLHTTHPTPHANTQHVHHPPPTTHPHAGRAPPAPPR